MIISVATRHSGASDDGKRTSSAEKDEGDSRFCTVKISSSRYDLDELFLGISRALLGVGLEMRTR